MPKLWIYIFIQFSFCFSWRSAFAEDASVEEAHDEKQTPEYRTVVRTPRNEDGQDAQRRLNARSPGFATAIDLTYETGARPADASFEVLARSPGASVRSIGGLGQFSAISLRGSSQQQVAVFLDGVPIQSSMAGLFDLSQIPLDHLARIDVYRSYVPVAFGAGTIGGAIHLQTLAASTQRRVHSSAGYGSYGARQAQFQWIHPLPKKLTLHMSIGYAGAEGNFPFYDTGNTPQVIEDDRTSIRINNDYNRTFALVSLHGQRSHWRFSTQQLVFWKEQGIPGTSAIQASNARLDTFSTRTLASVRNDRFGRPGGCLEWVFGLGFERQIFRDPRGEVGVGTNDQHSFFADTYVSPRLRMPVWKYGFLTLVADQRSEFVNVKDRATGSEATRMRFAFGLGIELEQFLFQRRLWIVPSLRLDGLNSRFRVPNSQGEQGDQGQNRRDVGFSPRLATRLRIVEGLEARATVGRYFRPPTLMELFGDRGYTVGNEGLLPEAGTAVDGGFIVDPPLSSNKLHVYAQAAGFATWSQNLIQWVRTGPAIRPINIAGALVAGMEASVAFTAWSRHLILQGNYTFLHSEQRSQDPAQVGKQLPGRPQHEVFARISTGHRWQVADHIWEPRLFYTLDFIAGNFLDANERFFTPARVLHGIGAELHIGKTAYWSLEVRNFTDQRITSWINPAITSVGQLPVPISDFIGYPLPGLSVWTVVRIGFDLPSKVSNTT